MSQTIHDFRVQLRDKTRICAELEEQVNNLELELEKRDKLIKEKLDVIKKKDDIITIKEHIIQEKDNQILKLQKELESSLEKNNCSKNDAGKVLMSLTNKFLKVNSDDKPPPDSKYIGTATKSKRVAISAEPTHNRYSAKEPRAKLVAYPKNYKTQELIKNAIYENDFMKNLDVDQIEKIVECMYPVEFEKNSFIIHEGDMGYVVYITEEGQVEVSKNNKTICKIGNGKVFGELAILYNCTRTATVKALTFCKLWAIDRDIFQTIMMQCGIEKHDEYIEILQSIPNFKDVKEEILAKLVDVIDECSYMNEEYIIRQFAKGETFYIISKGRCKVTRSSKKYEQPQFVKYLEKGDYFGEEALLQEESRNYNVIVDDPEGVLCLTLDHHYYNEFLKDPSSTIKRNPSIRMYKRAQTQLIRADDDDELDFSDIRLSEFEVLGILGVGGFGRVELVRNTRDLRTYALKTLKKEHIVKTKQQDHVINERNIMFEARSRFIVRLYKTYKDKKYLYLLLEVCLGGELWSLLREKNSFEEYDVKFYSGCVIEAFSYLHSRGIAYRDLKPENLILSATGYCKIVDFGFAKEVGLGKKTWTFCGTPEYVAPEVILNKGHDIAVDYWSLGVLIFELLSGNPPFMGNDPMSTYNKILKGIEAIEFPRKIPRFPANLIKRLCKENAIDRIGYQRGGIKDIQKHKWFEGFSWDNLRNGSLQAPYIPPLKDNTDTCNFDSYADDTEPEPEDDVTGWDLSY